MSPPLSQRIKHTVIGLAGAVVLRILNATIRWEEVGFEGEDSRWSDGKPVVLIFWHGRQLLMPWIYHRHKSSRKAPAMTALISQHSDGRMVAAAMKFLGIRSVAGSSTRGGLEAIHSLIYCLNHHSHIAVTPDGPKGPARKMKSGVVHIAKRSGCVVVPGALAAERKWVFKSWDSMILPKPFSRAVFVKGESIDVKKLSERHSTEEMVQILEKALNATTERADAFFSERSKS